VLLNKDLHFFNNKKHEKGKGGKMSKKIEGEE
jgi:hypothetical protein